MREGRCLCGAVRFTADGPPKWTGYCHCQSCRRHTGAPVSAYAGFEAAKVRFTGDLSYFESSPGVRRGFCGRCGTMLFFRSPRWPGELHVTRANFDGPVDREPQMHVFWDTHVDWVQLADGLPRKTAAEIG